jgi:GNAT superfamily N-acetyltransferase
MRGGNKKFMKVNIRKAKKSDFKDILNLITELAKFEKLPLPDESAKKRLHKHGFGKKRLFNIFVAESNDAIIGYAFYFFTYSSFRAKKTLYLEDIFITESKRNSGVGKLFFQELVKAAKSHKCGRMEWCVLDWNINAIKFYDKHDAEPLKDWIYYRMNFN